MVINHCFMLTYACLFSQNAIPVVLHVVCLLLNSSSFGVWWVDCALNPEVIRIAGST